MNRYPMWMYTIIVIAIVIGVLYSSPTLLMRYFGSAPIVQVSTPNAINGIDPAVERRVRDILAQAGVAAQQIQTGQFNVTVRLSDKEQQTLAQEALSRVLTPTGEEDDYVVSVNTEALTPAWLQAIGAKPVNLGLDLRGGVHFLLQVDMAAAINNRLDSLVRSIGSDFQKKGIQYQVLERVGQSIRVTFADQASMSAGALLLRSTNAGDVDVVENTDGGRFALQVTFTESYAQRTQELALQQNITTLHNRINALGVAEPVIQQQGLDRIVVQLPGQNDTATAKQLIGRTATLQIRLVDESPAALAALRGGLTPRGSERFVDRDGNPIMLYNEIYLTGENLTDAQPGREDRTKQPAVFLTFDGPGKEIFYRLTVENHRKRLAIVLFERGQGVVVTAPSINEPIPGGRVQISGSMTEREAREVALLLRSGSLAAPMTIIEERTIGPGLGAENIDSGVKSVIYGFIVVAIFMCLYYMMFGVFSSISMFINLLLLVTVLSMLQATLTLPGIAAMALALGISIDSNVLINERIREELRAGMSPQMAITAGYEHAWRTILDSNVTSLIAGIALLTCDAGPIRGFAIVHCLGILTSLFSSVFVSRGIVNLWYGRRRHLKKLSIGQVWKPQEN